MQSSANTLYACFPAGFQEKVKVTPLCLSSTGHYRGTRVETKTWRGREHIYSRPGAEPAGPLIDED